MNPIVLQVVSSLVVAGVSAWVGSKIGIRHAIEKLRKERAFDRRLSWYENCTLAIQQFRWNNMAYADALRHDRSKLPGIARTAVLQAPKLFEQLNQAIFYSPKATVHRLRDLAIEIEKFSVVADETLKRDVPADEFAAVVDTLSDSLGVAGFELAKQIRDQLGLDQIALSDIQ
jgi:hypothetical protein